jgi:hypothetical protein
VAVTVTTAGRLKLAGAVYKPLALMPPGLARVGDVLVTTQVTPVTVGFSPNCAVSPGPIALRAGFTTLNATASAGACVIITFLPASDPANEIVVGRLVAVVFGVTV